MHFKLSYVIFLIALLLCYPYNISARAVNDQLSKYAKDSGCKVANCQSDDILGGLKSRRPIQLRSGLVSRVEPRPAREPEPLPPPVETVPGRQPVVNADGTITTAETQLLQVFDQRAPPEGMETCFDEAYKWLSQNSEHEIGRDKSVFYSGTDAQDVMQRAEDYAKLWGDKTFDQVWGAYKPKTYVEPIWKDHDAGGMTAAEEAKYFYEVDMLSAAMARASSGDVRVVMPKTGLLNEEKVWVTTEWPELVRNSEIERIQWINPDDFGDVVLLWQAGDKVEPFPLNTPVSDIREKMIHAAM